MGLPSLFLNFDAKIKAIFLLCSFPSSWDTFRTIIGNVAVGGVMNFDDVMGRLLAKEIRRKSMEGNKQDATLNVQRGRK